MLASRMGTSATGAVIRSFDEGDTGQVIELWNRVWPNPAPHKVPSADIARKLADSPNLFLVAESYGRVVGTALAGFDGHRGWINRLAVDPDLRGNRIGEALVREAEIRLAAIGCHKVNLQIREGDEEVVAFYQRLGYQVEPRTSMAKLIAPTK